MKRCEDLDILSRLPDFLSWSGTQDVLSYAKRAYVSWVLHQLRKWDDYLGTYFSKDIRSLCEKHRQRVLFAPAVFALLRQTVLPNNEDLQTLRRFVDAELHLAQFECPTRHTWTALGDLYWSGSDSGGSISLGNKYKAARAGTIVLDPWSPHYDGGYPPQFGTVARHALDEVDMISNKILGGLRIIRDLDKNAEQVVYSATRVITFSRTPDRPNLVSAVSRPSVIGKIAFMNVHLPEWTLEKIADALVHESIHSILYAIELAHNFYTDNKQAYLVRVESPWSGRTLFLHSFVHACFVWFGLWNLWKNAPDGNEEYSALRRRALAGFLGGSPVAKVSAPTAELIEPNIRECIDRMSCIVMFQNDRLQLTG